MTSATHETPSTGSGLLSDRGRLLTGLAFVLGLATILGAWGSQFIDESLSVDYGAILYAKFPLFPCELCLEQRMAYYGGLPVLALVLILWDRLPRQALVIGLLIGAAIFAWGTYMGVYHAGVEMQLWPGPTACTGTGVDISFSDLTNLNATRVVPCDAIQFQLFGITLAGYNALISAAIVLALLVSVAVGRRAASSR